MNEKQIRRTIENDAEVSAKVEEIIFKQLKKRKRNYLFLIKQIRDWGKNKYLNPNNVRASIIREVLTYKLDDEFDILESLNEIEENNNIIPISSTIRKLFSFLEVLK